MLEEYARNPVLLWQHDQNLPIGRSIGEKIEPIDDVDGKLSGVKGLVVYTEFANKQHGDYIDGIFNLYNDGYLTGSSVGFKAHEIDDDEERRKEYNVGETGELIAKAELVEYSLVTVPCNPRALVAAMKSLAPELRKSLSEKGIGLRSSVLVTKSWGAGATTYLDAPATVLETVDRLEAAAMAARSTDAVEKILSAAESIVTESEATATKLKALRADLETAKETEACAAIGEAATDKTSGTVRGEDPRARVRAMMKKAHGLSTPLERGDRIELVRSMTGVLKALDVGGEELVDASAELDQAALDVRDVRLKTLLHRAVDVSLEIAQKSEPVEAKAGEGAGAPVSTTASAEALVDSEEAGAPEETEQERQARIASLLRDIDASMAEIAGDVPDSAEFLGVIADGLEELAELLNVDLGRPKEAEKLEARHDAVTDPTPALDGGGQMKAATPKPASASLLNPAARARARVAEMTGKNRNAPRR
jgi:HK97 family phage prohead protease